MTLRRVYFTCRRCRLHAHALDDRLGLDGFASPHARHLLCLVGAEWSFERSARHLREIAGLIVCDDTVRKLCDRQGGLMRSRQREAPEAVRPSHEAVGDVELQTDGACADTTGGWREVRLSSFAKRPRGEPATDLDAWDDRRLPPPRVRVATAVIRTSVALGPQWRRAAARLGIRRTGESTVLADGAKWIWAEVRENLPRSVGVPDVYHASEHLHATAVAIHDAGAAADAWFERYRRRLVESGAAGVLGALSGEAADVSELIGYLEPHRDHTSYRQRLAESRSIGSGLVEGACKTAIGRRLKQTVARWKVRRLGRMAAPCCLHYGEQFEAYWNKAAG